MSGQLEDPGQLEYPEDLENVLDGALLLLLHWHPVRRSHRAGGPGKVKWTVVHPQNNVLPLTTHVLIIFLKICSSFKYILHTVFNV